MLELQRLLTSSPASLPRRLIIDVGGILRYVQERTPGAWPVPDLIEVSRRTRRDALWVVSPPSVPGLVTPELLAKAALALGHAGVRHLALSATESVANMLVRAPHARSTGVVTAGIEDRPYELHLLDLKVSAMLDVGTGIVWDYARALTEYGEPALLPDEAAVLGAEPGEPPPGGAAAARCRAEVLAQLAGAPARSLPVRVQAALDKRHARANELRGGTGSPDTGVRELEKWLARSVASDTVHVAARVERLDGMFKVLDVTIDVAGQVRRAVGEANAAELLRSVMVTDGSRRWFAPRALDLLAAMVDADIALPSAIVDPAIVAYALRPGNKIDLMGAAPTAGVLPAGVRLWLADRTRATPAPTSLGCLLDVLPDLDAELARAASGAGIVNLVENDLAFTLPVLARIERAGAWVGSPHGYPGWGALRVEVEERAIAHEAASKAIAGVDDVYADSLDVLCAAVKAKRGKNTIPTPYWHPSLNAKQQLARLVGFGVPDAIAVKEARRLGGATGIISWIRAVEGATAGRLRGLSVPQWAGRWGMRDLAMQTIPKRSAEGKVIRSGLRGPPCQVLVGADQNGFEVRLLADLSGDPVLLQAAQQSAELHGAIAARLSALASTQVTRSQAKDGVLAVMYGQMEDSFWREQTTMTIADATNLYRHTKSLLSGVERWRADVRTELKTNGYARTRGGWLLVPLPQKKESEKKRSVFNGLVQGLGADIQRWVLRRLAQVLPPEARIVTQTHDDIVIACPLPMALHVEEVLVRAMTDDVSNMSGLLTPRVRLVANPKRGLTWGDLV